MNKPFRIEIKSNSPEVSLCEVFLSNGSSNFETGWMNTEFIPNILNSGKIVASAAINIPNIQVTATLDPTKQKPRVAVLLGKIDPMDRKIVEIEDISNSNDKSSLAVFWKDWKITEVRWNDNKLLEIS